ncbi:hypothetical protein HPP92_009262 [Vanilla planifolia]|uniref:Protein kinase domain-containing protein n=1 Tax=Vanilla planifolia TaxID=51239 RepID=A0A835V596_VANPL|nr:hypothetical protein HPP92_009262 [Vanilla planifolia]
MPSPTSLFLVAAAIVLLMDIRHLLVVAGECPLDLTWSNFTWAASACSSQDQRARCCRYLNAFVAVSVAHYGNTVGSLGVPSALNDVCLSYVSQIFESFGIPHNATLFCGVGPKIHVSYQCQGRTSVSDFLQSLGFQDVIQNCKMPFTEESSCRRCLNSGITYVHHLIGPKDNVTLNTCRDAAFVALTNQGDNISAIHLASCFFSIKELQIMPAAPIAVSAESPQRLTDSPVEERHGTFRLALSTAIGIIVTVLAILLVIIFVLFTLKRTRDLKFSEATNLNSQTLYSRSNVHKCYEGPSTILLRFSFKKIKIATNNFSNTIGRGRFWIMYKAQFGDGSIAAVKRLNAAAECRTKDFVSEMELLRKIHHRHLVALIGFCNERCERLFIYEYMENGSLEDHLHTSDKTPLTWQIRMEIASDVANALEYLHFYCDPSLYHGDIKSSNILLDKNFRAKVFDVEIRNTSTLDKSINTKPVNVYIHGTPGYVDPEYVLTHELTEKSDVYSYGVCFYFSS